jgi:phytoene dehydrogenase-like protein
MHTNDKLSDSADLVVIGGGLAGLFTSGLVARAGHSVIVLEQASEIGGRAATHIRESVHFNLGPHALYCRGHAFGLLQELGVAFTGRVPSPGRGLLLAGENAYPLPRGALSLLGSRLFTFREKARLIRLLATLPRIDARRFDRMALDAWVEETIGSGNAAAFLHALFRVSTYARDSERFSAGVAIDQLKLALGGNVWYLDGGWQTLVEGLRARTLEAGGQVRTESKVHSVRCDQDGVTIEMQSGNVLRGRAAVIAVPPGSACNLLDLPADAPLARWMKNRLPIKAACLDLALSSLPMSKERFALGLDGPFYFSVHSAAAKLAPEGIVVVHAMKNLAGDTAEPPQNVERELEGVLDRVQPGWRERVIDRRYLPGMTVTHALPTAADNGLFGRPSVVVESHRHVFLAGDWVGREGLLADASAASAREAAGRAIAALTQPSANSHREPIHVAV